MTGFRYIYLIVLLFCGLVFADFDYADSDSFSVNLLSIPSGDVGDSADSSSFSIDLYPVNRGWADSDTVEVITYKSLVVVTHGFDFWWPTDDPPSWLQTMCDMIEQADSRIDTIVFNWKAQSNNSGSGWAEAAGEKLASDIAKAIEQNGYTHVHLVGHSLGTVVVSEASRRLLENGYPVNQMTLLDAVDGQVYTFGLVERDNPYIYAWEGIERVEHYYGNGDLMWGGGFVDFTPWFTVYDGAWNVGPDIAGYESMSDYYHDSPPPLNNDTIYDYYMETISNPAATGNGWYYSLAGGNWNSDNGRAGCRYPLGEVPVIFNGDFGTSNKAGYTWQEQDGLGQWSDVDGFLRASLVERPDLEGDYAGKLDFDGSLASIIKHQDIIIPDDALTLWVQISENVEANSAFVVRFNDQEVGRIDYPTQTSLSFHFISFDLKPFAGQIGRLKFILDGYQTGQIWIDNLDIGRCASTYFADFDCSDTVDFIDLAYLCNRWLTTVPLLKESDLNGDAFVDFDDFTRFAQQWLFGVEP